MGLKGTQDASAYTGKCSGCIFLSICQLAGALPVSCQKRVNSNDDFDSLGGKAIRDVVTNGWE